jgi:hypothetical protein
MTIRTLIRCAVPDKDNNPTYVNKPMVVEVWRALSAYFPIAREAIEAN